MRIPAFILNRVTALHVCRTALLLLPIFLSCQLSQNTKVEETVSFDKVYDSLSRFDSVAIIFNDPQGHFLDTVFHGKVDDRDKIRNLAVDGWDGGEAQIVIIGYMKDKVAYKQEMHFNGATDKSDTTLLIVTPGTTLNSLMRDILLLEGDTSALPTVEVLPATLADKALLWTSSAPDIVQVKDGHLEGMHRGSAVVTASLRAEPGRTFKFLITVNPNPKIPESLSHEPDTLRIAAGGAPGKITLKASPSSADNAAKWRIQDGTIVSVSPDGSGRGLRKGATWAYATSIWNSSAVDSIRIEVSDSVAVESVRFPRNPLTLYVNGTAESLMVEIAPATANPEVEFTLASPGIVAVRDGKVSGIASGTVSIFVRSKAYPSVQDTLRITVLTGNPVSSISISPKPAGIAFTGGNPVALEATVIPSTAPRQVLWKSAATSIATVNDSGLVRGKAPGLVRIFAISAADSSKKDSVDIQVKRDMPQLNVGGDTTLSLGQILLFHPTVKKESGKLVDFRWDLNGDGVWDDSSTTLKDLSQKYDQEKEIEVRFYVRDNEGNDTLVYKKVKAVLGPVILIVSPANNSSTRVTPVKVVWTVNGQSQDTLPLEPLHEGANILTRKSKDAAGTEFLATTTIYYDTIPPGKPALHGPTIVNTNLPTWTWTSAGNGAGVFRYGLDVETFTGAETRDTMYSPATDIKEGTHTLFVQERDAAGNWSLSGRFAIRIDQTPPSGPAVRVLTSATTNVRRPKFTWASGGSGGGGFQFRLDNSDLTSGTTSTSDTAFVPSSDLSNGPHTLYVRESDSAGNWSRAGSAIVVIDTIPPGTPIVSVTPASPTNNTRPTWSWTSGGGGIGVYRYKLDDPNLNTAVTQFTGTYFQPPVPNSLSEGTHTLFVQESDSAGNWSAVSGSKTIVVDLTAPNKPIINQNSPLSPVNSLRPTMSWTSGGGEGNGTYRWKWDSNDLTTDATTGGGTSAAPASDLIEGLHTLYLQEIDEAGNPSPTASRAVYCMRTGQVGGIISNSAGTTTNTIVSPTGILYVYNGVDDVLRFNGSSWQTITQGYEFSAGKGATLLFNQASGLPNIGYGVPSSHEIHELTYSGSGTSWGQLWPLSANGSFYPGFALGKNGQQFIASYSNDDSIVRISSYSISTKWQSAFPDAKVDWYSYGDGRLTFAMDTVKNIPYFHLRSGFQTSHFVVMAYRDGSWKPLGTSGLASISAHQLKIMTSPSGVLHLVQSEEDASSYKIVLYKYDDASSAWSRVGAGAVVGGVDFQQSAVAFNSSGNPVVALNNGTVVEVYGLVRSTWIKMGNAGSVGIPISLAVGPNDEVYATSGSANLVTYKVGFNP